MALPLTGEDTHELIGVEIVPKHGGPVEGFSSGMDADTEEHSRRHALAWGFVDLVEEELLRAHQVRCNRRRADGFNGESLMAVRKLSNGKYQSDGYDHTGKRGRRNFDKKCDADKFDAQRKLFDNFETHLAEVKVSKTMLLCELGERYINEHLNNTRAASNATYVKKIADKWGSTVVGRISPPQVRTWVLQLLSGKEGTSYSVSTVKKIYAYFNRLFNWGIEMQIVTENPLRSLSFKKEFNPNFPLDLPRRSDADIF